MTAINSSVFGNQHSVGTNASNGNVGNNFLFGRGASSTINNNITIGLFTPDGNITNPIINPVTQSILLGVANATDTTVAHLELNKGVRIGATSGETQTMNGDDLYVKGFIETDGGIYDDSQTANTVVFLNANKKLTSISDGTAGQALVTNGAGTYSFQTVASSGSTDLVSYTVYGGL
jgi:hypothetical protein